MAFRGESAGGMDFAGGRIPDYDASFDKHCPLTQTQQFKRQRQRRLRADQASSSAPASRSAAESSRRPSSSEGARLRLEPLASPGQLGARGGGGGGGGGRQSAQAMAHSSSAPAFSISTLTGGHTYGAPSPGQVGFVGAVTAEGAHQQGLAPLQAWARLCRVLIFRRRRILQNSTEFYRIRRRILQNSSEEFYRI